MESIWLHWLIVALGWPCHENDVICIPNAVFFSELQEGRYCDCDASGRNCCKDQLKRRLVLVEITYESLQQTETIVARHWERPVICSRLRGIKQWRKDTRDRVWTASQSSSAQAIQSAIGSVREQLSFSTHLHGISLHYYHKMCLQWTFIQHWVKFTQFLCFMDETREALERGQQVRWFQR